MLASRAGKMTPAASETRSQSRSVAWLGGPTHSGPPLGSRLRTSTPLSFQNKPPVKLTDWSWMAANAASMGGRDSQQRQRASRNEGGACRVRWESHWQSHRRCIEGAGVPVVSKVGTERARRRRRLRASRAMAWATRATWGTTARHSSSPLRSY